MENRIWNKNISILEKKIPYCRNIIQQEMEKECSKSKIEVVLEKSYCDEQISAVVNEGKKYYLSGKYNPEGIAERTAEKIVHTDYGAVVYAIGFADGRVIRHLERILKKDTIILVNEPSLEIFVNTLQHYDVTDLLESEKIYFFIEGINREALKDALSYVIDIDNVVKINPLILGNYEQIFSSEVKEAVSVLYKSVEELRIKWNTMMNFSKETLENSIQNSKYLYHHYSVNELYNRLPEGVPAIIVAAGPSLDKNIEMLKAAKGKACIIACDTALKPLLKRDIIPDFFVVVDPRKPLELFDEPRIQKIPMISGLNIPVKVMEQHKGKKFFWLDEWFVQEILEYVFEDELEKHPMGCVATGGSVATSAFSIGRMMDAKTIILVGQDLAFTGGKQHAAGAFRTDQSISKKQNEYPEVEGIDGTMLPTLKNLKFYLEWFEEEIEKYKDITVIDATEGGALIHGSKILTLKEAINQYCIESFDMDACIASMEEHFSDKEREKVIEFYGKIPKRLEKIQKEIVQAESQYKKLERCARRKSCSVEELKKIYKKIKKVTQELEKDTFVTLIAEGIKMEEYLLRVNMYKFQDDEKQDLLESARMAKSFLKNLDEQLKKIKDRFEELSKFQGDYEC